MALNTWPCFLHKSCALLHPWSPNSYWHEAAESLSYHIHRDFALRPFLETKSLTSKYGKEQSPLPENFLSLPLLRACL